MAELIVRSGVLGTSDLGLDLFDYPATPRPYDPAGAKMLTVQNAQHRDVTVEYTLHAGANSFHPLAEHLPPGASVRSLVAVADGLTDPELWQHCTLERVFARTGTRASLSSFPLLTPAITLSDGTPVVVTHLLQFFAASFADLACQRMPKQDERFGDDFVIQFPGKLRLFAGAPAGPLLPVTIDAITSFDRLVVAATTSPEETGTPYPPK